MIKDTFVFYKDWLDAIETLSPESQIKMFFTISRYAIYGELPSDASIIPIFQFLKGTIDRDAAKYEAKIDNRSRAGKNHTGNQYTRAKNGTNGTSVPNVPNLEQNGTNGTNGTVNVNDNIRVGCERKTEKIDFQGIIDEYNKAAAEFGFHKIKKFDQSRKDKIKRLLDDYKRQDITEALLVASKSNFLRGGGSRGWAMSFDFFVNKTNFLNILEGAYNDKDGAAESKSDATHIRNTDEKEWGL